MSSVGGTDEGQSPNLPYSPSRISQSFETSAPKGLGREKVRTLKSKMWHGNNYKSKYIVNGNEG